MQSLCLEPLRTSAMASASVSEPWPYFQNARGAYNFAYIDFKMRTSDINSNTFDREPLAGALLCLEAFQRFCKLPHLASTDDPKKKEQSSDDHCHFDDGLPTRHCNTVCRESGGQGAT